jgi:hypothetical protein
MSLSILLLTVPGEANGNQEEEKNASASRPSRNRAYLSLSEARGGSRSWPGK